MGPRIIQHDNLDKVPASGAHDSAPWTRSRVLFDWRGLGVLCGFGVIVFLLAYWLFGQDIRYWFQDHPWIVYLAVALAILSYAKRWLLIEQPGGYKIFFWQVDGREVTRGMTRTMEKYAARTFPQAAQLTLTNSQLAPPENEIEEAEVIAAVPMLPPSEWLPWFDTRPHGLLAAETGGGKSTTFKAVVKSRIERGELVFLIDPHSSDWFGLPSIGGGEDWRAVWCGMQVVIEEYTRRMQERDAYLKANGRELPHDYFRRITVLLDEANTACLELTRGTRRGEKSRWGQFALALGSGARKVGLSIQLLAQSANVEDLGMSGPMVHNFTRLCLDARSVLYLVRQSGDDPERKRELLDTINGQPYPAAALQNGRVVLLDRTGLDQVGTPHNPHASLWTEGYERAEILISGRQITQQPARPAVAAQAQASATVRASVPVATGAIVYPATVQSTNGKIAWLLRQGYSYRQIERELSVSHATIRQVSVALQQNKAQNGR